MHPNEWLQKYNRKPFTTSYYDDDNFWYWGQEKLYDANDPRNEDDEIDYLLPDEIFEKLKQKTTYPDVKMYFKIEDALEDFNQAYFQAVASGWTPSSSLV